MAADLVTLAEAVKDELNLGSFVMAITATRAQIPEQDIKDASTVAVTVIASARSTEIEDRAQNADEFEVQIGVQKKTSETPNTAAFAAFVDQMMQLTQEISDFLERKALSGMAAARWRSSSIDPVYSPIHLRELNQFTSVITVTYSQLRNFGA